MQIRLWRQGKKTVAVFDGESPPSPAKRARTQIGERHDELSKAVLETDSETGDTADRSTYRSPHRSREEDGTVTHEKLQ